MGSLVSRHRVQRTPFRLVALAAAATVGLGCRGDDLTPPGTGEIVASVATSGETPDPDGYSLSLDGLHGVAIEVDDERTFEVEEGDHTLELAGLAANCAVTGDGAERIIRVAAGETVPVTFEVACSATTGGIRVRTVTTGAGLDPDGYEVSVDGGPAEPVEVNGTLDLTAIAVGAHEVVLGGVADNCEVDAGLTRTVTVAAGETVEAAFEVACTAGVERWIPMTSGTAADLTDAWGVSGSDVFTAGELETDQGGFQISGLVLHYDGGSWSQQRRVRDASLRGVWGASSTDVYAVGFDFFKDDGKVLHYDGVSWTNVPGFEAGREEQFALLAVWGSSASDVYTVGSAFDGAFELALIFHYDGASWTRVSLSGDVSPALTDVWGSAAADVYVVGRDDVSDPAAAVVLHYDGAGWAPVFREEGLTLTSVWGSSATDVFAAGFTVEEVGDEFVVAGAIRHYDGRRWAPLEIPTVGVLQDLWGTGPNDVFAVGDDGLVLHYDGAEWTAIHPTEHTLLGVWGSGPSDVFAVGDQGTILHGTP